MHFGEACVHTRPTCTIRWVYVRWFSACARSEENKGIKVFHSMTLVSGIVRLDFLWFYRPTNFRSVEITPIIKLDKQNDGISSIVKASRRIRSSTLLPSCSSMCEGYAVGSAPRAGLKFSHFSRFRYCTVDRSKNGTDGWWWAKRKAVDYSTDFLIEFRGRYQRFPKEKPGQLKLMDSVIRKVVTETRARYASIQSRKRVPFLVFKKLLKSLLAERPAQKQTPSPLPLPPPSPPSLDLRSFSWFYSFTGDVNAFSFYPVNRSH